ncbi:hypothetical protein GCM10011496_10120 [Polaromonas eurypsychrophila]|uniref:DUF3305 domain-containing protein n=2 Tax=Polaromonas eurypsychrophila TaxID=1614635 RepID=A0A916WEL9_9BURK|nr:DUF3305 domain-containing protein [Polaromonas eurypsychrophila]GGA91218.1 hypothetical protein GCM10011496_10120 [Polaromonas eurypsychrophila]
MSEFALQSPGVNETVRRPCVAVAVIMRRERIDNRWQPWRWSLADIVPQEDGFGAQPRLLLKDEHEERWLHPGFKVELFTDDAEGYYLNVSTSQPCFWVVWRMEEEPALAEEPVAVPQIVTLSYHDAGRWLDAQETVEQVAAPREVVEWVQAFVGAHYVLEAKRRQRPQSFKPLQDRFGNPARVSTDKKFGGGGHG